MDVDTPPPQAFAAPPATATAVADAVRSVSAPAAQELPVKVPGPELKDVIPEAKLKAAGAAALAAAAVKAKLLADQEERRMQLLVLQAIETQSKKLDIKFSYLQVCLLARRDFDDQCSSCIMFACRNRLSNTLILNIFCM